MNTATVTWPGPGVVQPAIERPTAMRLAETEYQRVIDVVDALQFEDWTRPTDCTAWDVRQLVAHIAGHAKLLSSPFELARQLPFEVNLWSVQNNYYELVQRVYPEQKLKADAGDTSAQEWIKPFLELGEKLYVKVG